MKGRASSCCPLWSPSTHRKPVDMAEVTRGMGGATLEKGCAAHFHLHQLRLRLLHLSRHT